MNRAHFRQPCPCITYSELFPAEQKSRNVSNIFQLVHKAEGTRETLLFGPCECVRQIKITLHTGATKTQHMTNPMNSMLDFPKQICQPRGKFNGSYSNINKHEIPSHQTTFSIYRRTPERAHSAADWPESASLGRRGQKAFPSQLGCPRW